MTNFIVNPENGKTVSIFSREGKRVLGNYLWTLKQMGGSLRSSKKHRSKHKKCRSCGRKYRRRRQYGGSGGSGGGGGGGGGGDGDSLRKQRRVDRVQLRRAAATDALERGKKWGAKVGDLVGKVFTRKPVKTVALPYKPREDGQCVCENRKCEHYPEECKAIANVYNRTEHQGSDSIPGLCDECLKEAHGDNW